MVRFYKRFLKELEDAACLIEISLFVYVLDDEMNKFSHIHVGAGRFSTPPCEVLFPTAAEVREGL